MPPIYKQHLKVKGRYISISRETDFKKTFRPMDGQVEKPRLLWAPERFTVCTLIIPRYNLQQAGVKKSIGTDWGLFNCVLRFLALK